MQIKERGFTEIILFCSDKGDLTGIQRNVETFFYKHMSQSDTYQL